MLLFAQSYNFRHFKGVDMSHSLQSARLGRPPPLKDRSNLKDISFQIRVVYLIVELGSLCIGKTMSAVPVLYCPFNLQLN